MYSLSLILQAKLYDVHCPSLLFLLILVGSTRRLTAGGSCRAEGTCISTYYAQSVVLPPVHMGTRFLLHCKHLSEAAAGKARRTASHA